MAAVSIIYFLTFAVFFFLKFIFEKNKKNLYYSILIFLFSLIYYYISYSLKISSIYETSNITDCSINRSLYLIFKGFFHQNNILFGLFLILTSFFYFIKKDKILINNLNKNYFFILLIIFSFLTVMSISIGKVQIYDRYKDFFQIFGFLTLFLYLNLPIKKYLKFFLVTLISIVVSYNCLFFLDKFREIQLETRDYDKSITNAVKNYKNNNILIKKEHLHYKAKRFPVLIMKSIDNDLF